MGAMFELRSLRVGDRVTTLVLRLRGLDVTTFGNTMLTTLNSSLIEELGARYVSTKELSLADASTGGSRQIEIPADKINLDFVLGNKVAFGNRNANREYFESGVKDLSTAELPWPGWLEKLLTHEVKGLENYAEIIRLLTEEKGSIKVCCDVTTSEGAQSTAAAGS